MLSIGSTIMKIIKACETMYTDITEIRQNEHVNSIT